MITHPVKYAEGYVIHRKRGKAKTGFWVQVQASLKADSWCECRGDCGEYR